MKHKDWVYISRLMWVYAENNERLNQRISRLLKELVKTINENKGGIIDDYDKDDKINGSNTGFEPNTTSNTDFEGTGEF